MDEVRADWKGSIRRACTTFLIDTSLYHYKSKRGDQAALKIRIKEITATRVRHGYRRIHSFNGKFRSECLNAHWFLTLEIRGMT